MISELHVQYSDHQDMFHTVMAGPPMNELVDMICVFFYIGLL